MNTETLHIDGGEEREPGGAQHSSSLIHGQPTAADFKYRLGELETENARLHTKGCGLAVFLVNRFY